MTNWQGRSVVVAAPGPSIDLAPLWLTDCRLPTLVVNDAYRRIPNAHALYATDARWWNEREGARHFKGRRITSIGDYAAEPKHSDGKPKLEVIEKWNLVAVPAFRGNVFMRAGGICYGDNSGFAALNLAILWGATTIYLVGFDMKNGDASYRINNRRDPQPGETTGDRGDHFFGDHSGNLNIGNYAHFVPNFINAARELDDDVRILNCTPGSALQCFETLNPYQLGNME